MRIETKWRLARSLCLPIFMMGGDLIALPCLHKDQIAPQRMIVDVVEYRNSPTRRETVEDYARSHKKKFEEVSSGTAATGKLICGKSIATANLTINGDTIVSCGHVLTEQDTCTKKHEPQDCKFQVLNQPPIPVADLFATGINCPGKNGKGTDWAIFKLARPVKGVKPYRVPDRPMDSVDSNKPMTLVGAMSADFKRRNPLTKKMEYPKHLQDCFVKRIFVVFTPLVFASNCDGSLGKSGGAVLTGDVSDPQLVGISTGNTLTEDELTQEARTATPIVKDFDDDNSYDSNITLAGDFLKELRRATK